MRPLADYLNPLGHPINCGCDHPAETFEALTNCATGASLGEKERAIADHRIGTREEWLAAREELLKREKEHTRQGDEIAQRRRDLPWVRVEKDYRLDTDDGEKSLAELVEGWSQLLVYHFMFGPSCEAGCTVNSSIADSIDGVVPHLHARDATMILVSQAPLEKLHGYKRRMGWTIPWVFSTFARDGDDVFHAYSTTWRGLEFVMTYYPILDHAPKGRDEGPEDWQLWIRRHDDYDAE